MKTQKFGDPFKCGSGTDEVTDWRLGLRDGTNVLSFKQACVPCWCKGRNSTSQHKHTRTLLPHTYESATSQFPLNSQHLGLLHLTCNEFPHTSRNCRSPYTAFESKLLQAKSLFCELLEQGMLLHALNLTHPYTSIHATYKPCSRTPIVRNLPFHMLCIPKSSKFRLRCSLVFSRFANSTPIDRQSPG